MKNNYVATVVMVLMLLVSAVSKATHNRSGEILYKRLPPFTNSNYTYSISVVKYFDDGPNIADRCADTIFFGDGSKGIALRSNGVSGSCCATSSCGVMISTYAGYRVKMSIYSVVHTYPGPGSYVIRSSDPNRTSGITNIPNSGSTVFYIESVMNLTPNMGENSSPVLSRPPIDRGQTGQCFFHNACAYDLDGDSLSYELITCKDQSGQTVPGYFLPPVSTGGSFSLDAVTGLLTWCGPQIQGVFQIAFLVKEFRKFGCPGTYQQLGYVERDMEMVIAAGSSPFVFSSTGFQDTCIVAGAVLSKTLTASISPGSTIEKRLYGYMMAPENAPTAVFSPTLLALQSGFPAVVSWTTYCSYVQRLPQPLYVAYTNPNIPIPMTYYRQMRVKVLPPSPKITSAQIALSKVTLQWQAPALCAANISGYNIYRKFGTNSWSHAPCETGAPSSSGFSLIGSTSSSVTSFVDNDLWTIPNGSQGNYLVTALMNNCAESYADSAKVVTLMVGLKENKLENSVKVFPNPFSNSFEIQIKGSEYYAVETTLYSLDGKLLQEKGYQNVQNSILIDARDLSPGVYFLKLKSKDETANLKLIKE
ncbi:MAG: T9SS type A sorting domain-containing protein [bacterium]|nr:T9SS type A sorting domain-containing protein [bacterium]